VYEGGLKSHKPPFTCHSGDWERQALPILSESARGYVAGNAGAGSTYAKNITAFDKYRLCRVVCVPPGKTKTANRYTAIHQPRSWAKSWISRSPLHPLES
jgi:hypothetical protein